MQLPNLPYRHSISITTTLLTVPGYAQKIICAWATYFPSTSPYPSRTKPVPKTGVGIRQKGLVNTRDKRYPINQYFFKNRVPSRFFTTRRNNCTEMCTGNGGRQWSAMASSNQRPLRRFEKLQGWWGLFYCQLCFF